jgi:hypothetical protein
MLAAGSLSWIQGCVRTGSELSEAERGDPRGGGQRAAARGVDETDVSSSPAPSWISGTWRRVLVDQRVEVSSQSVRIDRWCHGECAEQCVRTYRTPDGRPA